MTTYIGAGAPAAGNNAAVTPPLPSGIVAGDTLICAFLIRLDTATPVTPSGWTPIAQNSTASGPLLLTTYYKIYAPGDSAPICNFTGGKANATTIAKVFAFRAEGRAPTYETSYFAFNNTSTNRVLAAGTSFLALTARADDLGTYAAGGLYDNQNGVETAILGTTIGADQSALGADAGIGSVVGTSIRTTIGSNTDGTVLVAYRFAPTLTELYQCFTIEPAPDHVGSGGAIAGGAASASLLPRSTWYSDAGALVGGSAGTSFVSNPYLPVLLGLNYSGLDNATSLTPSAPVASLVAGDTIIVALLCHDIGADPTRSFSGSGFSVIGSKRLTYNTTTGQRGELRIYAKTASGSESGQSLGTISVTANGASTFDTIWFALAMRNVSVDSPIGPISSASTNVSSDLRFKGLFSASTNAPYSMHFQFDWWEIAGFSSGNLNLSGAGTAWSSNYVNLTAPMGWIHGKKFGGPTSFGRDANIYYANASADYGFQVAFQSATPKSGAILGGAAADVFLPFVGAADWIAEGGPIAGGASADELNAFALEILAGLTAAWSAEASAFAGSAKWSVEIEVNGAPLACSELTIRRSGGVASAVVRIPGRHQISVGAVVNVVVRYDTGADVLPVTALSMLVVSAPVAKGETIVGASAPDLGGGSPWSPGRILYYSNTTTRTELDWYVAPGDLYDGSIIRSIVTVISARTGGFTEVSYG